MHFQMLSEMFSALQFGGEKAGGSTFTWAHRVPAHSSGGSFQAPCTTGESKAAPSIADFNSRRQSQGSQSFFLVRLVLHP